MLIDLHTHTRPRSPCSALEPGDLIKGARHAGLDAICLTEHEYVWTEDEVAALDRLQGLLVLRGMEVTTQLGHMLVFGLQSYPTDGSDAEVLRRRVREVGGFMILAHPGRSGITGGRALELVDAVEIYNGANQGPENRLAVDLCVRYGLPGVGGGDVHARRTIGSCATAFQRRVSNERELIAELQAGRFHAVDLRQAGAPRAGA